MCQLRPAVSIASAYHFLIPPLGILFGWMILGEHVAAQDLFGIVPVALGIYLVTRPAKHHGNKASVIDAPDTCQLPHVKLENKLASSPIRD